MLACDAEGSVTSVSHKLRRAALAFTDCVIYTYIYIFFFLQAFHTVKLPTVFAKNRDFGGCRNLSHAQTQTSPKRKVQLFKAEDHHEGSLEGFQAAPGLETAAGEHTVQSYGAVSLFVLTVFPSVLFDLTVDDLDCK